MLDFRLFLVEGIAFFRRRSQDLKRRTFILNYALFDLPDFQDSGFSLPSALTGGLWLIRKLKQTAMKKLRIKKTSRVLKPGRFAFKNARVKDPKSLNSCV